jgi:hypothetical protein
VAGGAAVSPVGEEVTGRESTRRIFAGSRLPGVLWPPSACFAISRGTPGVLSGRSSACEGNVLCTAFGVRSSGDCGPRFARAKACPWSVRINRDGLSGKDPES